MKRLTLSHKAFKALASAAMLIAGQSAMAQYVGLTALSGSKIKQNEGVEYLVDGKIGTKWGQSFNWTDPNSQAYVIMKADQPVVPKNYFLCTGGDTGSFKERNWEEWEIYGGNFASADEATVDAEGWTLIDRRDDGDTPLPPSNSALVDYTFNRADGTTAYEYFYIRVKKCVAAGDIWAQMDEFGLCTVEDYKAFLNKETSINEPISYKILEGTRNNGDGEGLPKLFDGNYSTKWGTGIGDKPYFIVRTSRAICPEYYKLVTGTDNATWQNRNWRDYEIYAIAETDESKIKRDSEGWYAIDTRTGVTKDELPDKNSFEVFFDINNSDNKKYQYFKVEIHATQGDGYMQMTEFALGDEHTLKLDIDAIVKDGQDGITEDIFAQASLIEDLNAAIAKAQAITKPGQLSASREEVTNAHNAIVASEGKYKNLSSVRNTALAEIENDNLTAAAADYLTKWASEETVIEPNDEFPVGNYAYIKANRALTGDEAAAEASRVNKYINDNIQVVDDPINTTYTLISGTEDNWGTNESPAQLIDGQSGLNGTNSTKWGTATTKEDRFIIFKADNGPIKPTYYGLVTGGDTDQYRDRNWHDWKIWGANFDSDEDATKDSEAWVLLDNKQNVGTDILKTTNCFESYIYMSEGCSEPYQYFKIEVYHNGGMQMNEFTWYNQGNFIEKRDKIAQEVEAALLANDITEIDENTLANKELVDKYLAAYKAMMNADDAPSVMSNKNECVDLISQIVESMGLYEEYRVAAESVSPSDFSDYEQAEAWAEGYTSENEGPGVKYIRGTMDYILENRNLNNDELKAEMEYIDAMIGAALDPDNSGYIVLGGHTVSGWGDSPYKNLVDNVVKEPVLDKDGNHVANAAGELMYNSKWGGNVDPNGDSYVIFRTIDAVNPFFYTLTTGGDTFSYSGRNWKTWEIYGANFEGDGEATKDAEGWVLVDRKENIGQNRLSPASMTASYFGFSTETTEPYMYYKVVVYEAYSGSQMQMQELRFGTEEEFDEIKAEYINEANTFNTDVVAEQALIDAYAEHVNDIDECVNMEALFRTNDELASIRTKITESVKAYEAFAAEAESVRAFLDENPLEESEALAVLASYLNDNVEPNEVYPNGSVEYILDEHVLADSVLTEEKALIESMKTAAVAAGYVAGTDITSMIVNPRLATAEKVEGGIAFEGWDGIGFGNHTRADGSMSAAEFKSGVSKFNISQTMTDMKPGYYEVKLNAVFRPNGEDIYSYNHAAIAYANDMKTIVPVSLEGMASEVDSLVLNNYKAIKEYPELEGDEQGETLGYVVWDLTSVCHAFSNNNYEISMVAKVGEDGKLTFGLKNGGSTFGGDWTGAGNFRLTYLGEDADDAVAAAIAYNAERATTMIEVYAAEDVDGDSYNRAANISAAELTALEAISGQTTYDELLADGALFEEIVATKQAYVTLNALRNAVYDKWINHIIDGEPFNDEIIGLGTTISNGDLADAATINATAVALEEKYPDYLEFKDANGIRNLEYEELVEFEYDVTLGGDRPFIHLATLYNKLNENETLLTFEYKSETAIEGGEFIFGTPIIDPNMTLKLPTLEAASEWTTVTIDITDAVKNGFGAPDHQIRWRVVGEGTSEAAFSVRHILVKEKKAIEGDVNQDGFVTVADIVTVQNYMAEGLTPADQPLADINGDGFITVADVVSIQNIMAGATE